jgi:hypothetical protein
LLSGLRLWVILLSALQPLLAPPLLLRRYRAPLRAALRGLRARTLLRLPLAPLLLGCHGSALSARPLLLLAATLLATGALAFLTCSLQFACSSRSLGRMGGMFAEESTALTSCERLRWRYAIRRSDRGVGFAEGRAEVASVFAQFVGANFAGAFDARRSGEYSRLNREGT